MTEEELWLKERLAEMQEKDNRPDLKGDSDEES